MYNRKKKIDRVVHWIVFALANISLVKESSFTIPAKSKHNHQIETSLVGLEVSEIVSRCV